ncbi:MAG: FlgD immunoglobulin-like domain containing protein, partial [Candidatus Krumholzibacteriia bacterium]
MRLCYKLPVPAAVAMSVVLGAVGITGALVRAGFAGGTASYMQTAQPSVTSSVPGGEASALTPPQAVRRDFELGQVSVGPNVRVTASTSPQNETSIAVDPNNSNRIVGGVNDYSVITTGFAGNGVVYSADGGASWTHHVTGVALPLGFAFRGGDPCLQFDTQGTVFYGHIAIGPGATPFQANNGIFVAGSGDGGATWGSTVAVAANIWPGSGLVNFEDKPYITVDQTSGTFQDRIYMTWTRFYSGNHPAGGATPLGGGDIMVSSSSDGGATWTVPLRLPVPGNVGTGSVGLSFVQGSEPEVAPNGDLFVTFWFGGRIEVWRSTNGGASFTQQTQPFGTGFTVASVPGTMPGNSFRINAFPNIEADLTRPNHIYVVAADDPSNVGTDTDIIFARSADNGATWSTVTPLNDDTVDCAQIFPWMAVSQKGAIHVIWYDSRVDIGNCHFMNVFGAYSIDGGLTFDPNFRVTNASFEPNTGQFSGNSFFGDYNGLASGGLNGFHALWTDTRRPSLAPEQEIYYAGLNCNLTALTCPANTVIPAFSTVPVFTLSGFSITNTATAPRAYDYSVSAAGPGTLTDLGNPASVAGTTPVLSPGASFVPPNAGINFPSIISPSVQTATYTVNPVTDPGWTEQCVTIILIQPPVPVAFQAFRVRADVNAIRLLWDVREAVDVIGYNVYRSKGGEEFQTLNKDGLLAPDSRDFVDRQVDPGREYTYRIGAVEPSGEVMSMPQKASAGLVGIRLDQNSPNPFNPTTSITFAVPKAQHVRLTIFDVGGKRVRTLLDGEAARGVNNVSWDATNDNGDKVGSGVYYYMLVAGNHRETRKMVL